MNTIRNTITIAILMLTFTLTASAGYTVTGEGVGPTVSEAFKMAKSQLRCSSFTKLQDVIITSQSGDVFGYRVTVEGTCE
jgi:hypothetical protein